jgi:curved DNA-binding protein
MEYKDYYKILGVSRDANDKAIRRAYRQLARQYYPDKNPGDRKSGETFKEINEAYKVLGDAGNRSKYDRLGHDFHRCQQTGGNPADFDFSQLDHSIRMTRELRRKSQRVPRPVPRCV